MYGHNNLRQRHGGSSSRNVESPLKMIDGAVVKAHTDLMAAGESVSAWKVGQSALVILKAVSFESLGFSMQNVPSLFRIMITEAKVNSFIHCFVGVQKITSLHDLEIALCESQGIESFEELQLGPILKHPLVVHYFSLGPDTTEIFKITCEQVVSHLSILLRKRKKIWDISVDDLLDHIAKKKMQSRENLCIRIQSLGMHIGNIMRGRRSEFTLLKKCSDGLDVKAISDDNEDDGGNTQQDEDNDKNNGVQEPVALSEAIHANKYCTKYAIHRAPENLMIGINLKSEFQSGGVEEGFIGDDVVDGHTWRFIKIWKDTCDKENVIESFSKMLDFYFGPMKPKKKIKALNKVTTSYPNVGLLNVAIASIKFGLWDRMSSAPQANSKEVLEKEVLVASKNVLEDCSSTFNETKRCNDRVRSFQGKQVSEISFCTKIAIHRTPKMWMAGIKFKPEFQSVDVETGFIDDNAVDGYTWRFIKIWKETSEKENVVEAFGKMLDFYHGQMKPKKKAKALNQMITSYPYVGLLNVAISSIKFGLWDRMSTIPQANREVLSNTNDRTCAADANMDVELAEKDVIVANKDECRGEFQSSGVEEGFIGDNVVDGHTWRFIKIWKDTCDKKNVIESFSKMLDFYLGPVKPKKKNKALNKVITSYPNVGLLNVAIASIKFGLWDRMSSAPQANSEEVLENTISATCALDVNVVADLAEKEVLVASKNVLEDCSSTFNETKRCNDRVVSFQGKQVSEISFCTKIAIHRTPKMWMAGIKFKPEFQSVDVETGFIDDNAVDGYTWRFIKIWKETSEKENVVEAFGKMLDFYHGQMKPKKKAKALNQMIMSYPYVGLLNVAIASIKFGLWDRMSTIPQAKREVLSNTNDRTCAADANMDVELAEKDECRGGIALEDVLQHVKTYFMAPNHALDNINSYAKKQLVLLREVYKLECSLTQRFSVNDFETLGFGDLFTFLAERISLLPTAWRICLETDEKTERPSVRVCMSQRYLLKFLSEAANSLEENELLSKLRVSELLRMQFPSAGLTLVEDDFTADLLTTMSKSGDKESSNVVLFSANLSDFKEEKCFSDTHVGTNDAIKLLLGAPMLVDLTSWLYWDYKFAPSLGPLVEWLLSDLITKELLCLVTKDGKVLRIDHSATVDSFLEAFLSGSSFETAVKLLSLIALYGGERNVPLSLLKCHAKNAFEVMLNVSSKNSVESVPVASRFVLDCLCSLPREFRSFAAELLVSAFRSIIKDATMVILSECKSKDDHLMIHELGLLLGIVEWFDNDCSCLSDSKNSLQNHRFSFENEVIQSLEVNQPSDDCERDRVMTHRVHNVDDSCIRPMLDSESEYNAANIIKSIRMEEFGLDPNISITESRVLKKQHARLGRALHCLSEELYSQDSHFLLELVQNADDNVYPRNVEPTLTFILQEKRIVVLNNENGFSAENIRALCDVGNSTKKKSSAGYIGKKGIGFKSVFRVTDAPEIHSNGFHIKFDLTEGQIGFVLPTIVPPCDIDLFSNLVSSNITDQVNQQNYNTCIVLPLKSKLTETSTLENITSMFSDLHPSLLLFLHRLECIKFRNMINNSFIIMRKEVVGNGLTNVYTGSKTLTWFVESRILQANGIRNDVKTTEISVAFALDVSNNGIYSPILDQQYVFAFLPLRTYGLKFIIQGDFILPSSREEVDGDSPWNQWLLSEFPSLFVNSEKSFCNLPSFKGCLGKGVSAFMSYVPLVGEVHGFFAMLPRMIMSKLCTSNCLLLEGENDKWVPPCSVLRNWNEQVRTLLPDSLIQKHLGIGYLNKEIILPDSLSRALGIKNYGPQILVHMLSSLCCTKDGLTSMGLNWLSSWLTELYSVSLQNSVDFKAGSDIMNTLRKTPFIPLLDGSYGSVEEGMIWMNLDGSWRSLKAFTRLFANLRIVDPALFDGSITENLIEMLSKVGVQRLSAHQVVKSHILPAICDKKNTVNNNLMTEYLSFIMVHVQSSCSDCCNERGHIISEVYNKAFILTNHGFVLPFEMPIHFNNAFGNHIDTGRLINGIDVKWYEVDKSYLKYPTGKSMRKWRKFLKDLGVTDFVQTVQVEKTVPFSSQCILTNMMWQKVIIPPGSTVSDWESRELVDLLVNMSLSGDFEKCKYLLEVLDEKWDAYFSDKGVAYCNLDGESKSFKSSLVSALNDVRWVASSLDNGFHYPKDLYHDCETVCLILGDNAPYAVPKILNEKLISSIGFKRTVTLDDALSVLEIWKRSATSFKASVSQMSRFYSFLCNELASSTKNNMTDLLSEAFIFVPLSSASSSEVVPGVLLSPEEVYWHDTMISSQCEFSKMLSNLYPGLHDFFVNKCGVKENPPLLEFLSFLSHLSTVDTPTKAAKKVFDVFVMWSDEFKSGGLSFEDVEVLKKNLEEKEMKVLPTARDEWVSLHPSFGLVCWCDDEKLADEFEELNNINFFSLCELTDEEKVILKVKVSAFMKILRIPALSEIVTREAIYYGPADNSYQTSLVSWVLPYAQRYISNSYHERYLQLKLSGFEQLKRLHIVVVEKLFYKNVIRRSKLASKKRHDISCLLQDEILYMTHESDSHTIFMELSRFLINGNTELHLANFLHMLTTMSESGSTGEQIEAFILNNQKVPKLLDEEPVWSIQSNSNWPPSSWKTASKFTSSCVNDPKLQDVVKFDHNACSIEENVISTDQIDNLQSSTSSNNEGHGAKMILNVEPGLVDQDDSPGFSQKDRLSHGTANVQQAFLTGRRGEELAFYYYSNRVGIKGVKWVNEVSETGLPYDIEVYDDNNRKEYIEVKTTKSARKDWFEISAKEWQFAVKSGESFSIARVVLSGDNAAKVSILNDPARLCRIGRLKLALLMSKEQEKDEFVIF